MKQHFLIQHEDQLEQSRLLSKPYQMKFQVISITCDQMPEDDEIAADCLAISLKENEQRALNTNKLKPVNTPAT